MRNATSLSKLWPNSSACSAALSSERTISPRLITGSSMGSVVGGAYAAGVPLEQMKKAVETLRLLDLIAPAKEKGGIFGTKKMRALLVKYIGDKNFHELKIPFHCVAVDMLKQEVMEFSEGNVIDAIVASSCIPAVFHPQQREGMQLIDGGILERVPAMRVKEMGADVIVAVDVLGWRETGEKVPGTIGVLLETIDIMDNYRTRHYKEEHEKENFNRIDYYDFYVSYIRFVSSNYAKSGRTAESSVRTACGSRRT